MAIPPDLLFPILAAPYDDLPRLVAADWLDEHGQTEWAEFIRTQIAEAGKDNYELLYWLAYKFFPNANGFYANAGKNTLKVSYADQLPVEYVFRRGFVDEVRCSLLDWVGGVCPKSPLNPNVLRGAKCLPGCETCHRTGRAGGGWGMPSLKRMKQAIAAAREQSGDAPAWAFCCKQSAFGIHTKDCPKFREKQCTVQQNPPRTRKRKGSS
jgi:uncharacterized protein (TIGR02996 family)